MNLQSYVSHAGDILRARQDIVVENFQIILATAGVILQARLRFYDHSVLIVVEEIEKAGLRDVRRLTYKFHYQNAAETLIFRYDDAPHHPHLLSFPHHKHIGGSVIDAEPTDLADVLREIDVLIYPANDA